MGKIQAASISIVHLLAFAFRNSVVIYLETEQLSIQ